MIVTVELEVEREGFPAWVYTVDLAVSEQLETRADLDWHAEQDARNLAAKQGLHVRRVVSILRRRVVS